jgi:hypothetical protein
LTEKGAAQKNPNITESNQTNMAKDVYSYMVRKKRIGNFAVGKSCNLCRWMLA